MSEPVRTRQKARERRAPLSTIIPLLIRSEYFYAAVAAVLVLSSARLFYGALRLETEHVLLWNDPSSFDELTRGALRSEWSAPLDDVFIHFDFARSAALGAPFEWTPGNGYSSGGTSLLYPFVLALGLHLGWEGLDLMHFAALVATVSTFAFLLSARRAFRRLTPSVALLAPLLVMSTGVLDWSLFSGMEVALFLAAFGACFVLWDDAMTALDGGTLTRGLTALLGLGGLALVGVRPEAAPLLATFGLSLAYRVLRTRGVKDALVLLLLVGAPGAVIVGAHMAANEVFTGSSSAAGALAKLELHHPYMTGEQIWKSWLFFLSYQFFRLSDYHFSAIWGPGYLIWPLALISVIDERTRRHGALLLTSVLLWTALVALNGQVRWQNERYAMPAVALVLLAAALGSAAVLDTAIASLGAQRTKTSARVVALAPAALVVLSLGAFFYFQAPRYREQVWFFGRASRNILEQHVAAGRFVGHEITPRPRRILLSDAGAIPYAAGLPAFDLIGLGGYHGLPIAEASRQGVGAAVELLGYVPASTLPDVMTLYPGWWGQFVLWFGTRLEEFPVRGNVICGGASKVVYAPDFSSLEHSDEPLLIGATEALVDRVDVADLISERTHGVSYFPPKQGYVTMKLLPDPRAPSRDLWDAGRVLAPGGNYTFHVAPGSTHVLLRIAPATPAQVELQLLDASGQPRASGQPAVVSPHDGWQELRLPIPGGSGAGQPLRLRLDVHEGELHLYQVFSTRGG